MIRELIITDKDVRGKYRNHEYSSHLLHGHLMQKKVLFDRCFAVVGTCNDLFFFESAFIFCNKQTSAKTQRAPMGPNIRGVFTGGIWPKVRGVGKV